MRYHARMQMSFDLHEFLEAGGMAGKERAAAARAVENERRDWLPILEDLATQVPTDDLMGQVILEGEVRRLRRLLGLPLPPTPEVGAAAARADPRPCAAASGADPGLILARADAPRRAFGGT
jgi:hypothetical protein